MLEFDENGYDQNGFNNKGIHKDTETKFDPNGFDCQGYDEFGLNKYGFTRDGHSYAINEQGEKILVLTKTTTRMTSKGNDEKFGQDGVNPRGFLYDGKNVYCQKENPELGDRLAVHDRRGFLLNGEDIETGTLYNKYGYDAYGYNKDGYDEYGFNEERKNEFTGTELDLNGNDYIQARAYYKRNIKMPEGLDKNGFDGNGLWNGTSKYSKETELDVEGYDKYGFNIHGIDRRKFRRDGINSITNTEYDEDGYDINGYNKDKLDRDGFDVLKLDKDGINRETGKKDERVVFAEEFINLGKSIDAFAREKGLDPKNVEKKLEEMKKSSFIGDKVSEALEKNTARYIQTINSLRNKVISGELNVRNVDNIDIMIKLGSPDEQKAIMGILVKEMATHSISIMNYKRMYSIKDLDSNLPSSIMERIDQVCTFAKRSGNSELAILARELYKERDRIKVYKAPYQSEDLKTIGYIKPGDKNPTMLTITDEHRELARQYLIATGDFICYKTMSDTFMKIAKGEIDEEKLLEIKAKKEKIDAILEKQKYIEKLDEERDRLESQRGLTNE